MVFVRVAKGMRGLEAFAVDRGDSRRAGLPCKRRIDGDFSTAALGRAARGDRNKEMLGAGGGGGGTVLRCLGC